MATERTERETQTEVKEKGFTVFRSSELPTTKGAIGSALHTLHSDRMFVYYGYGERAYVQGIWPQHAIDPQADSLDKTKDHVQSIPPKLTG